MSEDKPLRRATLLIFVSAEQEEGILARDVGNTHSLPKPST